MSVKLEVEKQIVIRRDGMAVASFPEPFYNKFEKVLHDYYLNSTYATSKILVKYGTGTVRAVDNTPKLEALAAKCPEDWPIKMLVAYDNHADHFKALEMLEELGYTKKGINCEWKPPIGEKPDFDLIDIVRKAPEGATHVEDCEDVYTYLKSNGTGWFAYTFMDKMWIEQERISDFMNIRSLKDLRKIIGE